MIASTYIRLNDVPFVPFKWTDAYGNLIDQLFDTHEEHKVYKTDKGAKRLTIPQNFLVVGTVNMDETIRDLYEVVRVHTDTKAKGETDDKLRNTFDLKYVHRICTDFEIVELPILRTFADTTLDILSAV